VPQAMQNAEEVRTALRGQFGERNFATVAGRHNWQLWRRFPGYSMGQSAWVSFRTSMDLSNQLACVVRKAGTWTAYGRTGRHRGHRSHTPRLITEAAPRR
jgi:hypothetical protein